MNLRRTVASFVVSVALLGAALVSPAPAAAAKPFGVMFASEVSAPASTAKALGVTVARPSSAVVLSTNQRCVECVPFKGSGIELLLTVKNSGGNNVASSYPRNLSTYKRQLATTLDDGRPRVLVVENEQDARNFYTGTPTEYASQLKAACEVAHVRGILCTDGGMTWTRTAYMVYQSFLDRGDRAGADAFARDAFRPADYAAVTDPANATKIRSAAQVGRDFVTRYKAAGADYVNFHWYSDAPSTAIETARYLRQLSGLPVISNEIGDGTAEPSAVTAKMQGVLSAGLEYAIWFSVNKPNTTCCALTETDGRLRLNGVAYRDFASTL